MEGKRRDGEPARVRAPHGGTGPEAGGTGWGGSPWGVTGWGVPHWDTIAAGANDTDVSTVSTSGEDASPAYRIDSDHPNGRVDPSESLASRKDDEMTEMESEVPMAREEHAAPSVPSVPDGGTGSDPEQEVREDRAGRHYRNDGDTGQFTRILGDAPRPAEGPRRHRYREDGEENEVLTRILGH